MSATALLKVNPVNGESYPVRLGHRKFGSANFVKTPGDSNANGLVRFF